MGRVEYIVERIATIEVLYQFWSEMASEWRGTLTLNRRKCSGFFFA